VKTALTADRHHASAYDIPSLLRERLRAAMRRNPRFSLRSFAKQLGIDHSTLSQVLRSRRRLSARALESVGKRMGLSEEASRFEPIRPPRFTSAPLRVKLDSAAASSNLRVIDALAVRLFRASTPFNGVPPRRFTRKPAFAG